jgi:hypothetical protein
VPWVYRLLRTRVNSPKSGSEYFSLPLGVAFHCHWGSRLALRQCVIARPGPPLRLGTDLEPKPLQEPTPPIWICSWGSDAGLRRVARFGDGWLASAYNHDAGPMRRRFVKTTGPAQNCRQRSGKLPERAGNNVHDPMSWPSEFAVSVLCQANWLVSRFGNATPRS